MTYEIGPEHTREAPPAKASSSRSTHILYSLVLVAIILGVLIGFVAPGLAVQLKPLGTLFINLVKMMIAPIVFCSIVLGVGTVRKAATVGKVGGLALAYFLTMTTVALVIGLIVGNLVKPGEGLNLASTPSNTAPAGAESLSKFVIGIIPDTLVSALTTTNILQTLFVALLVGFGLQAMGDTGEPVLNGIRRIQSLVFRILSMIMWVAPLGAFGAMAAVVGQSKGAALGGLALIMVAFYITCVIFVCGVLGAVLKIFTGVNVFSLIRYLGKEYLLILATASSEIALPRLMKKMEHLGVDGTVVGITVPTGYSFNLDGTAIYLTMSSLFIAEALNKPFSVSQQIGLLVFMIIASKGAGAVAGAGLAALAAGLQSHRPDLVDGVGLIVGIDRFMAEARSLTNFSGNAVACLVVASWVKKLDREQVKAVLGGDRPFDEQTDLTGPQ